MDGVFLNGHQITEWKDIWRGAIVWRERFLPGECPSDWAHLALEPDECFYPQWGWDECWSVPALQCASESHLTGCPVIQEAAPQRKSSYLGTNWKRKALKKQFSENLFLYNLRWLSYIKYLTYITVWRLSALQMASNTLKKSPSKNTTILHWSCGVAL